MRSFALPGLAASPRRRLQALVRVLGYGALTAFVTLVAAWLFVRYAPNQVFYHDVTRAFRLHVLWSSLVVLALAGAIPRLAYGCALIAGGSVANAVAGSLWPGTPDYFSFPYFGLSDRVFNLSDVVLTVGRGCVLALALLTLGQGMLLTLRELRHIRQRRL